VALACATSHAAVGTCAPPGLGGGLLSAAGLGTSLAASLLGAPASTSCMPVEPASAPVDQPARLIGNPVDAITGVKHDRAVDLDADGRGRATGLSLVFTRHYASDGAGSGAFGPGWRHGFDTRLHALSLGADGEELQIVQGDGRVVRFARRAQSAPGGPGFAALRRDDGVLVAPRGRSGAWRWLWRDGRVLSFRADGRLVGIEHPGAASLSLAYDERGRLTSIASSAARSVTLRYGPVGGDDATPRSGDRLAEIEGPGGVTRYAYDPAGRLAAVIHADGARVAYRYDEQARLAGVTLPDGAASEYRYDAAGRVAYTRAAGQGANEALWLRYARAEDDLSGETLVAQNGVVRAAYRWRAIDGEPQLVAASGEGCAACPPTGVRYGFEDARLASVVVPGRRLTLRRDRAGRVVAVTGTADPHADAIGGGAAPAGSPAAASAPAATRTLVRIAWADDPWRDRPLRIVRGSVAPGHSHVVRVAYDRTGRASGVEHGHAPVLVAQAGGIRVAGYRAIRRPWPAGDVNASAGSMHAAQHGGPRALPAGAVMHGPGRWQHVAANGVVTRYWRDDFDQTVAVGSADSGLARWQVDDAGRVVAEQAADGTRARYAHDARGRLVLREIVGADGTKVITRFRRGAHGLEHVEHPGRNEHYGYDDRGRLVRRGVELQLSDGRRVKVDLRYRYDPDSGLLAARSLPDGSWLHLMRDAAGQVIALRRASSDAARAGGEAPGVPLLGDLARDRHGMVRARFGNGASVSVEHDAEGRVVRWCHRRKPSSMDCDLLDHVRAFDAGARERRWRVGDETRSHLFDDAGQLIQAQHTGPGSTSTWRFAWDGNGNRVLSQAHAAPDPAPRTTALAMARGTNRPLGTRAHIHAASGPAAGVMVQQEWDAAGRLVRDGERRFRWTIDGLLAEVSDARGTLARFGYDHRGARAWRAVGGRVTHHLQDESRQPLAEFDEHGRVVRQYVYLADRPVAVIDAAPAGERIAFLHLNPLGAPEAVTDERARVIWRAAYAPFGRRLGAPHVAARPGEVDDPGFDLALRLPGQLEDPGTGLHYNDHRYYDPDTGRYLSPDPLGLRGGPNPYAYAGGDPTSRVDPTGLLLFAFDGTGNSDAPPRRDDWSNVYKLARSYGDGRVWYMAGVGQADAGSGIRSDASDPVTAYTARPRVDWMLRQLDQAVASPQAKGLWLDVDVIGFSRGAAMGRDFANRVADRIADRAYERLGACVRLRFLGLWDTVAQFGAAGAGNFLWRLAVPPGVAYTAHAVALNEHRMLFPGESILGAPGAGVRIERGFIGAHSDVGGSYAEGDLSDVSLNWMHRQATLAGVRMFALTADLARVAAPLLHDSRSVIEGDREFRTRNAFGWTVANPMQRVAPVGGMQWRDTGRFIERYATPLADAYGNPTVVGQVDMAAYADWLAANYGVSVNGAP